MWFGKFDSFAVYFVRSNRVKIENSKIHPLRYWNWDSPDEDECAKQQWPRNQTDRTAEGSSARGSTQQRLRCYRVIESRLRPSSDCSAFFRPRFYCFPSFASHLILFLILLLIFVFVFFSVSLSTYFTPAARRQGPAARLRRHDRAARAILQVYLPPLMLIARILRSSCLTLPPCSWFHRIDLKVTRSTHFTPPLYFAFLPPPPFLIWIFGVHSIYSFHSASLLYVSPSTSLILISLN
jgi:hypothetical protein